MYVCVFVSRDETSGKLIYKYFGTTYWPIVSYGKIQPEIFYCDAVKNIDNNVSPKTICSALLNISVLKIVYLFLYLLSNLIMNCSLKFLNKWNYLIMWFSLVYSIHFMKIGVFKFVFQCSFRKWKQVLKSQCLFQNIFQMAVLMHLAECLSHNSFFCYYYFFLMYNI